MGISIGVLCMGRFKSRTRLVVSLAVLAVMANIPDIGFAHWGHYCYRVSHSIFVNMGLMLVLACIVGLSHKIRRAIGGWRIFACGLAGWSSHFLLDSLYNHGRGIAAFRPVSRARLAFPLPWFNVLRGGWALDIYTLKIVVVETLFYGGLLVICLLLRRFFAKRKSCSQIKP